MGDAIQRVLCMKCGSEAAPGSNVCAVHEWTTEDQLRANGETMNMMADMIDGLQRDCARLHDALTSVEDWFSANDAEAYFECRGDDDCDHCEGVQRFAAARIALGMKA